MPGEYHYNKGLSVWDRFGLGQSLCCGTGVEILKSPQGVTWIERAIARVRVELGLPL